MIAADTAQVNNVQINNWSIRQDSSGDLTFKNNFINQMSIEPRT